MPRSSAGSAVVKAKRVEDKAANADSTECEESDRPTWRPPPSGVFVTFPKVRTRFGNG